MNNKSKIVITIIITILVLVFIGTAGVTFYYLRKNDNTNGNINGGEKAKIDDWKYNGKNDNTDTTGSKNFFSKNISKGLSADSSIQSVTESSSVESKIGYSVGGSKNIQNFRENINSGYLPISTDITYNGLFYDYYFDTGKVKESSELFSPSYSMAVSNDPISSKKEYYMTVGLNSNIKQSDFKRKKQNIVVLLDISGSMSSNLNDYYYDAKNGLFSKAREFLEIKEDKSKMKLANESINLMIDKLNGDDRFGMVLFDDKAYLAKPINLTEETNMDKIKEHILEIEARGGTNFEAGYTKATELFTKELLNDDEYDNRIIVITDAMPNMGTTSKKGLLSYVKENAQNKIYTSFIGIGVDFNTELIEEISNVKGANYYSINNKEKFQKILSEDFDYMITPLVFDLNLNLSSNNYEIEGIYGTDSKDKSSGNIIKVNTLFPSSTNEETGTKGGVVLLKLKKKDNANNDNKINLNVSYTDRNGKKYSNSEQIEFENDNEFYANSGIRKSIALVRYANCLKNWILYERSNNSERFYINNEKGIIECSGYTKEDIKNILGENERTSTKLSVSGEYKNIFEKVKKYLENEKNEVKDDTLKQEIDLLQILINY